MKPVLVLYATREGHTERIAGYLSDALRKRGAPTHVVDVADLPRAFTLKEYSATVLAASVHRQNHEPEMKRFVVDHRRELEEIPAVFLSVSLSAAGAEDEHAPSERRHKAAAEAKRMIDRFLDQTGWRPSRVKAVAGALPYTKYNFLLRLIMKRISRQAGGDTDTSRDYDYTDWSGLNSFVEGLVNELHREGRRDSTENRPA